MGVLRDILSGLSIDDSTVFLKLLTYDDREP